MNKLLDILSISGTLLVLLGVLFLIQEYTIGQIGFIKDLVVFNILPFRYLVFTASSLIFILKFVDIYIPKRK